MNKYLSGFLLLLFTFSIACNTTYKASTVQYNNYRIQRTINDNAVSSLVKLYGDSVNKKMDVVIGENESMLERKRQGNTLGYFIADAYLEMAKKKMDPFVDVAFMNSGGIRLPELPAGPITQGKVFELMPFDNLMTLVKMKGSALKQYLDTLASTEGIIQSGLSVQVANRVVQQIMVGNKPIDLDADYTIVHSDYVVINTSLLKNMVKTTNGYLLRDAIIDYIKSFDAAGKKVTVSNTDRVVYVN